MARDDIADLDTAEGMRMLCGSLLHQKSMLGAASPLPWRRLYVGGLTAGWKEELLDATGKSLTWETANESGVSWGDNDAACIASMTTALPLALERISAVVDALDDDDLLPQVVRGASQETFERTCAANEAVREFRELLKSRLISPED